MIAKLIVAAPTREQALARLRRAIDDYRIAGVPTTLAFLRALIDSAPVGDCCYGTATLEAFARTLRAAARRRRSEPPVAADGGAETIRVEVNDRLFVVRLLYDGLPAARGPHGAQRRLAPRRAGRNGRRRRERRRPRADARRRRRDRVARSRRARRRGRRRHRGDEDDERNPRARAPERSRACRSSAARQSRRGTPLLEFEQRPTTLDRRNASGIPLEAELRPGRRGAPRSPPRARASPARSRTCAASARTVSRQALDDAPVRRFRDGGRIERALSLSARARHDRAVRRVRSADAARLRLRRAAGARRGRQGRRCDRLGRRHGDAARRHPARQRHDLDDDQRAGLDLARDGARGRAPARHPVRPARRDGPEQRPQRVRRARHLHLSAAPLDAARDRRHGILRAEVPRWNTISISGYHIREAGSTAVEEIAFTLANAKAYLGPRATPGWPSTWSRRASRSSGTRTTTSSKRSPSSAPRASCGRGSCATSSARATRARDAAFPHPDRRLDADRPRARQQRRPRDAAGARGGARRNAVAAHQRQGRSARAADRGIGPPRAANATDHRLRERGRRRRRSARGLVLRRVADRRDDRARARADRRDRRARRRRRGDPERLDAIPDRGVGVPRAAGDRARRGGRRRRQRFAERAAPGETIPLQRIDPRVEREQVERCSASGASATARVQRTPRRRRRGRARPRNLVPRFVDAVDAGATLGEICDVLRAAFGTHVAGDVFA